MIYDPRQYNRVPIDTSLIIAATAIVSKKILEFMKSYGFVLEVVSLGSDVRHNRLQYSVRLLP